MGIGPVREEAELLGLIRPGLRDVCTTMADVHAEKCREAVQVALALLVVDVATVAAHDDRDISLLISAHAAEVEPQVPPGQALEVASGLG